MRFLCFFEPWSKMKRTDFLLAACLALTSAQSFAREPQAPPSPSAEGPAAHIGTIQEHHRPGEEFPSSLYIGNYGEPIEIHYGWTADARMVGETEIVYFHPKFKDGVHRRQPYRPKQSDYTAENFAPMRLIELVVIPKNAPGGFPSLKAIRIAKEKELTQNHIDFEANEVSDDATWPLGTFHIQTTRPYRLWQIYSESSKEFYILTLGGPLKEGDYGLDQTFVLDYNSAGALLRRSLSAQLLAARKQTLREYLFKPAPPYANDFRRYLKTIGANTRYWIVLGAISIALMLTALWPGKSQRTKRANFIGRSLILFSVIMGLIGFLSVYIPVRSFGVAWRHSTAPELIPLLLVPWISWRSAKSLGSLRPKSVLLWSAPLAALLALCSFQANEIDNADLAIGAAFANAGLFLFLGLVFGAVFVLAFGPLPKKEEQR